MFRIILISVSILGISGVAPFALGDSEKSPKDVLFIAVDDLNDWTGHLAGHPQANTPNIDRLVARGVTFTNAHCAAPACNPSRAALMSGLRPHATGLYVNPQPSERVLRDVVTINRHFLANGYRTLGGGKIYHGFGSEGREDTWTYWLGNPKTKSAHVSNLNGLNAAHFDWGPLNVEDEAMGDYQLTDWAVEQLQSSDRDQPLFLAVGYVKPHLPWFVPKKYFDRFPIDEIQLPAIKEDDLADVPPAGIKMAKPQGDHAAVLKADQWKAAVQGYLATVSFLDDQVGRLLEGLDQSGRADNTIIVWWTDHGWHLGEKQHWRKFALWQDATRTSLGIVAPGTTRADETCGAPVDYLSIYPTLCELAGLPTPPHVTGPSLVPLLDDPKAPWEHRAVCTHGRGNHAVYDERWHLIQYADGSHELYDRQSDPNEWTNLAGDANLQERIRSLQKSLPAIGDEAVPLESLKKKKRK